MMATNTPLTIAVIGCGTLGTAIAKGILDPLDKQSIAVNWVIATVGTEASKRRVEEELSDSSSTRLKVLLQNDNEAAMRDADVVIIATKPVKRSEVFAAQGVKEALRGKLVISIMAGITTKELARLAVGNGESTDDQTPFQAVRVMPNMAAKIREALSLCTADFDTLTDGNKEIATWIFNQFLSGVLGRFYFWPSMAS
ncbi:hypothetical protein K4K51_008003 [Colletotrichum sp. SAR 10_75]|nr:hypothetical protein K4K51_008003 [Colletotrichum sp. SAR 10_75]